MKLLSLSIKSAETKNTNTPRGGGFGLADSATQSTQLLQDKNETAAGVAHVKAAAVDLNTSLQITNCLEM